MTNNRVLHIVTSLNYGGVESRMRTIAINSKISKYEHYFCSIGSGGSIAEELKSNGVNVSVLDVNTAIPSISAFRSLRQHIRRTRPAVLHCHGAEGNFHGLVLGRISGVPVCIAEEIGLPNHSKKARFVFRNIYKLANIVLAVSNSVKDRVVDLKEVESDNCRVLHNPFSMLSFRPRVKRTDSFDILYAGRLEEVKNPGGLIDAVALLKDRNLPIKVHFVGDGSQRRQLEERVCLQKLDKHVYFYGFVPKPFDLLDNIDLFILPSFTEGLSNSLVEAMSAGIPSLATAVGGTTEVISDGINGWLSRGTDPGSIAECIEKCFYLDARDVAEISERGRESVLQRFSASAYFLKCDSLYDEFLDR